ncbi:MAG: ATP-binding cassette domain-containing protein [Bacteroidales bacterium]|nr:ATP-binding cassette domain-containing protein [Bacteroidales bacterium]
MSDSILKALMRLFAIIAASKEKSEDGSLSVVESFLRHEVSQRLMEKYIDFYKENYSQLLEKQAIAKKHQKFVASASTKILVICEAVNKELVQYQKVLILVRLLEFIKIDNSEGISSLEQDCVMTVAQKFNVPANEYKLLTEYIFMSKNQIPNSENILVINSDYGFQHEKIKHIYNENLSGQIIVLAVKSVNMYLLVIQGENDLTMNSQLLNPARVHVLSAGSSLRGGKIKPVYYSDIISTYNYDKTKSRIVFEVDKLEYKFSNGETGLHSMSFIEKSGNLVGIMGASGAGKTTLLNVLNGNFIPSKGQVLVNGIDLHTNGGELSGLIGYVSQDDHLIEELTVFQNLYYAAKQSFDNYSQFKIYRTVLKLLKSLGLYEIRNMKAGSPSAQYISGGQRKRLNIALELIREPSVLFIDEPTSGLSSRDSENIMDLLKDLTIKGKLVFVVIHQPSSDIFKMLDNLILLDNGGYLIYTGDPVEAITYFKSSVRQANSGDSQCPECGNVNPEQIFNIVESKIIDEFGNVTEQRKITPKEWNELHEKEISKQKKHSVLVKHLPEVNFKIPGFFRQFLIFFKRDVLSKLANRQYVVINLLESPLIALVLSFIIKYRNLSDSSGYTLLYNCNLPVYLFISVIVAVFIGLTVSAQEIIKDRLIRKREAFMNLSKGAYLTSKTVDLLCISAYQSFMFVLIGNTVLEIDEMFFKYFIILFSVWFNANLLGLNISDGFKTTVTVYISIPFLIIPQIALSGVLISFDKLNPDISKPGNVPFYGDMLVARWAFEALAVEQFKNNSYEKNLYEYEKTMQNSLIKKDFWLKILDNKLSNVKNNQNDKSKSESVKYDLLTLQNELTAEIMKNGDVVANFDPQIISEGNLDEKTIKNIKEYFAALRSYYITEYKIASAEKDAFVSRMQLTPEKKEAYIDLKRRCYNESLTDFVTNKQVDSQITEYENRLYQKINPIYTDPDHLMLDAHFYAPRKRLFNIYLETFWVNVIVIWLQSVCFFVCLYFGLLRNCLNYFAYKLGHYPTKKDNKQLKETGKNRKIKMSLAKILR